MKRLGKEADQLAEVYSLVSYIVEDSSIAVSLILHVADFHIESQLSSDLTRTYHRLVLASLGGVVSLHIYRTSQSVQFTCMVYLSLRLGAVHTGEYELSGERHHPDVVAILCLHDDIVAELEREFVYVAVVILASILELYLHDLLLL